MDLIPLDYDPFAQDQPEQPQGVLPEPEQLQPPAPAPEPVAPPPEQKPTVVPAVTIPAVTNIPVIKYADQEKPKPAPQGLIPLDYDPFAAPKEEDSWTDPKDYAALRGAAEGLESIKGGADFLTVLDLSFGGKSDEEKKKIILEKAPDTAPTGWERRVPSISDIGSVGDVGTWLQESAGSGVTSTIPSVVGGLVGGVGGTALAGPVGGLIGGYGGAAIPSVALGLSGMYQDMRGNEGVRKALQDGTITPDQFQKIVVVGGLMTGALDSIPAAHWGGKMLGLEAAKKEIRETLLKAAIKGGFEEGGTEGLQQVVSEAGQDMGGGDQSIGQQALNVLDASLQGLVGGMIFGAGTREKGEVSNTDAEEPPKVDDVPDVAAPTQPEGTPVSTETTPDASTPGGVAATTPAPPAKVEETAAAATSGGVEVLAPGQGAADIAAALDPETPGTPVEAPRTEGPYAGMTPTEIRSAREKQRGAIPDASEGPADFNLRDELPEDTSEEEVDAATKAMQGQLKSMFTDADIEETTAEAVDKKRERGAGRTRVAAANDDTTAALEASAPPEKAATHQETLGTGITQIAQQPAPVATATVDEATGNGPEPVATAAAGRTETPTAPIPPVAEPLQPQRSPLDTTALVSDTPAMTDTVPLAQPAPEPVAGPVAEEQTPVAAFNVQPAAEPVTDLQQPATIVTSEVTAAPGAKKAIEVSTRRKKVTAPATEAKPAAEPVAQEKPKTAPAKAAAAVATSKSREGKAEVVTKAQLEADAAERKARIAKEQEERKAREAARSPLSRDIHKEARGLVSDIGISEGEREQMIEEEADKYASDPDIRDLNKDLSIRERIQKGVEHVSERVRKRAKDKEQAELDAFKSEEDKAAEAAKQQKEDKEKALQEAIAKRAEQAQSESGQKKERASKNKGLSSEGRKVQSHESLMDEFKKGSKNPLVAEYAAEHQKQTRLKKNPKPEEKADVEAKRAEHEANKAAIREKLVAEAQAQERQMAEEGLTKQHAETQAEVQKVLDAVPFPDTGGNLAQQKQALVDHLKAFKEKLKGVSLPGRVDRAYQSMQESLAVLAKKTTDPQRFAVARMLMETGNTDEFYNTAMAEQLTGTKGDEKSETYRGPDEIDETGGAGDTSETEGVAELKGNRDTDVSGRRVHREGVDEQVTMWGDTQAMIRHGKEQREAAQRERERKGEHPERQVVVTRPDGKTVAVTASTKKGSAVLRDLNTNPEGFIGVIQRALTNHLSQMVGNINVHFVSAADMAKLYGKEGAGGLYLNYSAAQRASGMEPSIFILNDLQTNDMFGDSFEYTHTVLHEMTHAATSLALKLDLRGTKAIISTIMTQLHSQMTPAQREQFNYAFKDDAEFVAEVFSNENFQDLLANLQVPPHIAMKISGVSASRMPNWMQTFAAAVSNAIGMRWGQRGQTYMEQVLSLFPTLAHAEIEQEIAAEDHVANRGKPERPLPRGAATADPQALMRQFDNMLAGAKSSYANFTTPGHRRFRDILSTGDEQIRRSANLFGGVQNPLRRLIEAHLRRDTIRKDFRRSPGQGIDNEKVENAQLDLQRKNKRAYNEMSRILHEMSRYGLDATVGLADAPNAHINQTGTKDQQVRAKHDELQKAWNKLPQEAKDVGQMTIDHYRKAADIESRSIIREAIENAQQKFGTTLPQGKTIDDAVDWVMSGDATKDVSAQTQADKDWHAALGKTATTLAKVPFLRKVKGVYVPFMRRGRYFISSTERPFGTVGNPKNLPKGAVLDTTSAGKHDAPNRLLFRNQADYDAFADSHPTQVKGSTMYVNPLTGQKTTSHPFAHPTKPNVLIVPRRVFVATVQNHRVELSDNFSQLVQRAKELQADGHHAGDVGISEQSLHQAIRQMAPAEITSLIRNLEQTTLGQQTVGQQALANSVYDAYIRSMASPGSLARGLKRRGTLGEDHDLVRSTRDYNRDLAHRLATSKSRGELNAADTEVKKYINDQQHMDVPGSGLTAKRQAMYDEVARRIIGFQGDSNKTAMMKISNTIRDIVTLRHLFSPHYSVQNMMQPFQTTLPILTSRHGAGAALEMEKAYRVGGRARVVGGGLKQSYKAAKSIFGNQEIFDNDSWWKAQMAKERDGAELMDVADKMRELGWGASSGIESPGISELDMNRFQRGVHRVSNIARALPEAIEGVNRYTTAIAAYRLARKDGMTHAEAVDYAALTVAETQGGYAAANNPTFFQNPLLAPALQFRKYSLGYGQVFYRNLAWMFKGDKQQRLQAGKALAGMALTTVALAGVTGLPLVEPLRLLVNLASGLTGDDWDDAEKGLQRWLAKMTEWTTGSKSLGQTLSEASMFGLTRLANIDTHGMFANDSMFLFGEPKSMDNEGVQAWLWRAVGGAPGGMAFDSGKHLLQGDIAGAVPWPKLVQNVIDGMKMYNKGTVDPQTGKQYHKPYTAYESIAKGMGFRPAEESRPFEAGGSAAAGKEMRQTSADRRSLMEKWRNKSPGERAAFFRDTIRDWNASHKNPDDKIQMQDLLRSGRSEKQYEKRLKKAEQYAD